MYGRNEDSDPQLVRLGKEGKKPFSIDSIPVYVQEYIYSRGFVEDICSRAQQGRVEAGEEMPDLFAD